MEKLKKKSAELEKKNVELEKLKDCMEQEKKFLSYSFQHDGNCNPSLNEERKQVHRCFWQMMDIITRGDKDPVME